MKGKYLFTILMKTMLVSSLFISPLIWYCDSIPKGDFLNVSQTQIALNMDIQYLFNLQSYQDKATYITLHILCLARRFHISSKGGMQDCPDHVIAVKSAWLILTTDLATGTSYAGPITSDISADYCSAYFLCFIYLLIEIYWIYDNTRSIYLVVREKTMSERFGKTTILTAILCTNTEQFTKMKQVNHMKWYV